MPSSKDYGFPEQVDGDTFEDIDLDLSSAEGVPEKEDSKPKRQSKAKKAKERLAKLEGETSESERKQPKSGNKFSFETMDDSGNARLLIREYGNDMRWDSSVGDWAIWNNNRWQIDGHEAVRRAMSISDKIVKRARNMKSDDDDGMSKLEKWGLQCGNLGRIRSMLEIAKSMPGIAVSGEEFNANKQLLACPNGTLVLDRDGAVFRKTSKEDLTTRITGCEYDPKAKSPMFEDFLSKFLPEDDLRAWAQKVAGYSMFGGNPKRRIVFCLGPTSSGKSTFAELVRSAMGTYAGPFNLSMLRENQDERPRPDLVAAVNQRIIFASEASSDWHLHADMIKRATGKDPILARLPHSGVGITKVPDFTPWIITNNVPTINGADQALYRRLCTVLFPHTIEDEKENDEFKDELIGRGELPGVLAWLVEGWNMYCDTGLSDPPDRVVNSEIRMREQFSDIDVFLSECCDKGSPTDAGYQEFPATLYEAYEAWADDNGVKGRDRLSSTAFGRALNGRGFPSKVIGKVDGKAARKRLGLRLKVK